MADTGEIWRASRQPEIDAIRADERKRCAAAICGYCYGPESETHRKMAVEFQPELGEYWHQWGDDYPIGRSRCHASAIHGARRKVMPYQRLVKCNVVTSPTGSTFLVIGVSEKLSRGASLSLMLVNIETLERKVFREHDISHWDRNGSLSEEAVKAMKKLSATPRAKSRELRREKP